MAELEVGGLSQQAFARRKRIKLGTFRSWLYKSRNTKESPRFVEVVAARGSSTSTRPAVTLTVGSARVEFEGRPAVEYLVGLVRGLDGASS